MYVETSPQHFVGLRGSYLHEAVANYFLASLADSILPAIELNTATFFERVVVDSAFGGLATESEGVRVIDWQAGGLCGWELAVAWVRVVNSNPVSYFQDLRLPTSITLEIRL